MNNLNNLKMSLNKITNIISEESPNIMEYLIQKLECRQRNLFNYVNMFNSINSIEEFYLKKKDILKLFQNLEEELRQASLAIKAIMTQNKALSTEYTQILDIKINYSKLLKENNYLLKENNNLTQKLKKIDLPSKFEKRTKSPNINDNQKHKNNNKYFQNRKDQIYDNISNNKNPYNNRNNNKKKIQKKLNNNKNTYLNESYDDIKGLKNVKAIIADMKKNKIKLKEVVNEHLSNNNIQ